MTGFKGLSRTDCIFLFCLLVLVTAYSTHLFSFTVFEGFSTFSNDAGSYVVMARKWSPFFLPNDAGIYTWPAQIYPPGFPWLLTITGASKSLWLSHLLVSCFMLASIFMVGWISYRRLGWLIGALLTIGLCLLPGVVISSMGILSENLYLFLSLVVLYIYSFMKKNENTPWVWYLILLILLTLVIMTRTIGIALIAAIFLSTLIDKNQTGRQKIVVLTITLLSTLFWYFWSVYKHCSIIRGLSCLGNFVL